jgi:hypothetical protein
MGWSVGVAVLLLVVAITSAVAISGQISRPSSASPGSSASRASTSAAAGGPIPVSASAAPLTPTSDTEPPATAIRLDYSGVKVLRRECSDATGGGGCGHIMDDYDPLPVRCTMKGCTVYLYLFGATQAPVDGPLRMSGDYPDPTSDCAPSHWTIDLTPVGHAVTEGIRHPARLVGTLTARRGAKILPKFNCLGADEVYRYDAVPS